jgi:toxin secretion/phage lysis holin
MKDFLIDLGIDPSNVTLYKLLLGVVTFLSPIFYTVMLVGCLIFFDFITGVIASTKNKEKITSQKASRTVYKILVYNILLVCGLVSDTILKTKIFTEVILYFLTLVEMLSVSENIRHILGINFIDFLKNFLENKMKNLNPKKD